MLANLLQFKFDFNFFLDPLCIVSKQRILMRWDNFVFTYYKSTYLYCQCCILFLVIEYGEFLIVLVGTSLPHDFIFSAEAIL